MSKRHGWSALLILICYRHLLIHQLASQIIVCQANANVTILRLNINYTDDNLIFAFFSRHIIFFHDFWLRLISVFSLYFKFKIGVKSLARIECSFYQRVLISRTTSISECLARVVSAQHMRYFAMLDQVSVHVAVKSFSFNDELLNSWAVQCFAGWGFE